MIAKARIHQALTHEGNDRYDGTIAQRQHIVSGPHLPEKNIIVETGKGGREVPESRTTGRLFDGHGNASVCC